jgi:hypothetical protein
MNKKILEHYTVYHNTLLKYNYFFNIFSITLIKMIEKKINYLNY